MGCCAKATVALPLPGCWTRKRLAGAPALTFSAKLALVRFCDENVSLKLAAKSRARSVKRAWPPCVTILVRPCSVPTCAGPEERAAVATTSLASVSSSTRFPAASVKLATGCSANADPPYAAMASECIESTEGAPGRMSKLTHDEPPTMVQDASPEFAESENSSTYPRPARNTDRSVKTAEP